MSRERWRSMTGDARQKERDNDGRTDHQCEGQREQLVPEPGLVHLSFPFLAVEISFTTLFFLDEV